MRKRFFELLYQYMQDNPKIYLITGDLGYRQMDEIKKDFPDRFINVGAAEQAGIDICVGLALEGKIPFWYSITPFALYRPFETLRTYINHENIPVKIIGGGRDDDYKHDGYSHFAGDEREVLKLFNNIWTERPDNNDQLKKALKIAIDNKLPTYINVRRA